MLLQDIFLDKYSLQTVKGMISCIVRVSSVRLWATLWLAKTFHDRVLSVFTHVYANLWEQKKMFT